MSKGDKSLWDLAIEESNATERPPMTTGPQMDCPQSYKKWPTSGPGQCEENKGEEKSVLFVGSKNAGKTSLILRFQDRDEAPKPTTALEYTFARRAKGHNLAKDVGHLWELGGGTWLSPLIEIAINPDNIRTTSVAIVVDLSKPAEMWVTLEKLLAATKSRVDSVLNEVRMEDPTIKDRLRQAAWERIGKDHPDKDLIEPFPIPLVIIGAKYDIFQDFDPEKRKIICKTLRFVAHSYGAQLQFFSTKQETVVKRGRSLISHLLFSTENIKKLEVDHNKPLVVPPGQDSSEQIGTPPMAEGDLGRVTARNPLELWKIAFTGHFPQENISDPSLAEDPAKDKQYSEAAVDAARAQRDEELERYRRLSERRMREAQQRAVAEGLA